MRKLSKARIILIMIGLLLFLIAIGFFSVKLVDQSHLMAKINPEIAFMRIPVLVMCEIILLMVGIAVVIALFLLRKVWNNSVFEQMTVKGFRWMGRCFLVGIMSLIVLAIYTERNVPLSITNFWVGIMIFIFFLAGNVFYLFAELFDSATRYKSENDLTV